MSTHRFTALPFALSRIASIRTGFATLIHSDTAIDVDLSTGTTRSTAAPPADTRVATRLSTTNDVASIARDGYGFRATLARDERRRAVFSVSAERDQCAWYVDEGAAFVTAENVVVCATDDRVIVVFVDEEQGTVRSSCVCVKSSVAPDVAVVRELAWVLTGDALFAIDLDLVNPQQGHRCEAIVYRALASSTADDPRAAVVTVVLPSKLLIDHPALGRLTIERTRDDPAVQKGDRLWLSEVAEEHRGLYRVRAWSLWTEQIEPRSRPAPMRFDAPRDSRRTNDEQL